MPYVEAVAPALAVLALAGVATSAVAAVAMRFLARATFAARAALLQTCVVGLLAVSVAAFVPRVTARTGAIDRRTSETTAGVPEPLDRGGPAVATARPDVRRSPLPALPALPPLLVGVWLLGVLVRLIRLARGARQLAAVRARARRCARHSVLVSDDVDVPFVHGWRSPVIVVPAASDAWTAATWRDVLLHESAHVARGDVAMKWVREIALALHWFDPAVRWLVRRTDEACEGACDDVALLHGSLRTQYAGTLVSFADAAWAPVSALSMATPTGLERRVAAILDRGRARRDVHQRDRRLPLLLGVLGGGVLALVVPRPAIAAARPAESARRERLSPATTTKLTLPTPPARSARDSPAAPVTRSAPRARERPSVRVSLARVTNDTTEALLGLGDLLDDVNPIVRRTASDALRAWGTRARAALEPVARTDGGKRGARARRALAALETPQE